MFLLLASLLLLLFFSFPLFSSFPSHVAPPRPPPPSSARPSVFFHVRVCPGGLIGVRCFVQSLPLHLPHCACCFAAPRLWRRHCRASLVPASKRLIVDYHVTWLHPSSNAGLAVFKKRSFLWWVSVICFTNIGGVPDAKCPRMARWPNARLPDTE